MDRREDLTARTVGLPGNGGDGIEAYLAQPSDGERHGGVVVIHHLPGYDEVTREMTRRFAAHGYLAVCPNLYSRDAPGVPDAEAAAIVRAHGGVPDERLVGDVAGSVAFLKALDGSNGRVATTGYCSGGRQSFLAACSLALDAAVDCYGGFVAKPPPASLSLKARPILHLAGNMSCPLLGLFGAEDQNPSPQETAEIGSWTSWGRATGFIPCRARDTHSSPPTAPTTGRRRPTRVGAWCGTSSVVTSADN